jgi:hypothetical protein
LFFKKTKKNYKLWEKLANMLNPKPNRYATSIVLTSWEADKLKIILLLK